jgi:hypothetical protein
MPPRISILNSLAAGTVDDRVMLLLDHVGEALFGLGPAMLHPVRCRPAFAFDALLGFTSLPQIDDITHAECLSPGRPEGYRR